MIGYEQKLERVLDRMGGLYTLDDIKTAIAEGKMQSFVANNSWAITQVQNFPRVRQLLLVALVGDLDDVETLHAKLLDYADEIDAGLIATYGRLGWMREGSFRSLGWRLKAKSHLYQRDM